MSDSIPAPIIKCPECKKSYQDYAKLLLKSCYSCHVVCIDCMKSKFKNREYREKDKNKCWLLGGNCRDQLVHIICPQCEDSKNVFHIMQNDWNQLPSLRDCSSQDLLDERKALLKSYIRKDIKELKDICDKALKVLEHLKTELNEHANNCRISKITGSSVGLVGGALFITGAILAPFTFGASTPLMIAGGVVGGVGGGVAGGTGIVELVINKDTAKEVEQEIKRVEEQYGKLVDYANQYRIALAIGNLTPGVFMGSFKFASNVGLGIFRLVQIIGETGGAAFRFSAAGLRVGSIVLHSVGSVLAAVTAVVDIVTIVVNSRELYRGDPADFSTKIEAAMKEIRKMKETTLEDVINMHIDPE